MFKVNVLSSAALHEATSLYDDTEQLDLLQKVEGVLTTKQNKNKKQHWSVSPLLLSAVFFLIRAK